MSDPLNTVPHSQNTTIIQPKDPALNNNHRSLKNNTNKITTQARNSAVTAPYLKSTKPAVKTCPINPETGIPINLTTPPETPTTVNDLCGAYQENFDDHDEQMDHEEILSTSSQLSQQERLENLAQSIGRVIDEAKLALGTNSRFSPGFDRAETAFSNLSRLFNDEHQGIIQDNLTQLTKQLAIVSGKLSSMDENFNNALKSQSQIISQVQLATAENLREIKAIRTSLPTPQKTQTPKSPPTTYATITANPPTPTASPTPKAAPPTNPKAAHHPSRLVIQFLPEGIPESQRRDPNEIVDTVNKALEQNNTRHLKVVAAKFNNQGNLILSTRTDQKAAELIPFTPTFINLIDCGYRSICREDKRWFKIQVDGISTTCTTIGHDRRIRTEEEIHKELSACNLVYQQASNHLTTNPRWMRTHEEILSTPLSSIVFAIDDEEHAKRILGSRTLAAFGRHCTMRAYQDRPPVPQCKNCWSLDHKQDKCTLCTSCRLCGQPHQESEHPTTPCDLCPPTDPNEMNTSQHAYCTHRLSCSNCTRAGLTGDIQHPADSRRCPVRLQKYGTARVVEKKALKTSNPWKTVPMKSRKSAKTAPKTATLPTPDLRVDVTNPTPLQLSIHNPSADIDPWAAPNPDQIWNENP